MALLTATVKLFIKRPTAGQELVPKVLKWATEEVDNPDLRDRGYIYWRLLSTDPAAAKAIVLSEKPPISTESDNMDTAFLDELLLHVSTLASIYHKSPTTFIHRYKPRYLMPSPVLQRPASHSQPFPSTPTAQQQPVVTAQAPLQPQQQLPQQQQIPSQQQQLINSGPLPNDLGYNSLAANR